MTTPAVTEFDQIVAAWDQQIPCEAETKSGNPCRRPGHWLIDMHGEGGATICGQHLSSWVKECEAKLASDRLVGKLPRCPVCDRMFAQILGAYVTAVRL